MNPGAKIPSCVVCEFSPAARHYGALCCEGCRAFFKRKVLSGAEYQCLFGGECRVAHYDRSKYRYCKACRYVKCLQQGMDPKTVTKRDLHRRIHAEQNSRGRELLEDTTSSTRALLSIQPYAALLFAQHIPPVQMTLMSSSSSSSVPDITGLQIGNLCPIPPCLPLHNSLLTKDDGVLVDTGKSVSRAAYCAFHEQAERNTDFMRRALAGEIIPTQPQQSVELTIAYIAFGLSIQLRQNLTFLSLLPGYAEVEPLLDQRRLHQRAIIMEAIFFSFFFENDEYYMTMGMTGAHLCRYWLDRLVNRDLLTASHKTIVDLKTLDLTPIERFLIMAAVAFKPVPTIDVAAPPSKLAALHGMYINALEHSIRARLAKADSLIDKTHQLLAYLETFEGLMQHYVPPENANPNHEEAIFCGLMKEDEGIITPPNSVVTPRTAHVEL